MTYPIPRRALATAIHTNHAPKPSSTVSTNSSASNSVGFGMATPPKRNDTLPPEVASTKFALVNKLDDLNAACGVVWGVALSSLLWAPLALWWLV